MTPSGGGKCNIKHFQEGKSIDLFSFNLHLKGQTCSDGYSRAKKSKIEEQIPVIVREGDTGDVFKLVGPNEICPVGMAEENSEHV